MSGGQSDGVWCERSWGGREGHGGHGPEGHVMDFCLILRATGSPWLMDPEEWYENVSILKRSLWLWCAEQVMGGGREGLSG